jgi:hypothetical protein
MVAAPLQGRTPSTGGWGHIAGAELLHPPTPSKGQSLWVPGLGQCWPGVCPLRVGAVAHPRAARHVQVADP